MGFYGNVFYELANAFGSILIQKKYNDSKGVESLDAVGTGGSLTLKPKNRWIELEVDKDNYTCSFKHAEINPNQSGTVITPFEKVSSNDSAVQLTANDTIAVPRFSYDSAGHIIKTNGVSYYKLPINETEQDLNQLKEDMAELTSAETNQNNKIQKLEDDYGQYGTKIQSLENNLNKDIQNLADITKTVNNNVTNITNNQNSIINLESLVGNKEDFTNEPNLTLAQVIGNFDETGYDSVSKGLVELNTSVNAVNSSTANNALAMRLAFTNLCEKLKENNININVDDLWDV